MDGRSGWCGAMSRRFIFNNSVVSHASVEKYCLLVFLCGGKDGWEEDLQPFLLEIARRHPHLAMMAPDNVSAYVETVLAVVFYRHSRCGVINLRGLRTSGFVEILNATGRLEIGLEDSEYFSLARHNTIRGEYLSLCQDGGGVRHEALRGYRHHNGPVVGTLRASRIIDAELRQHPRCTSSGVDGSFVGGRGKELSYDGWVRFYLCEEALMAGECTEPDLKYSFDLADDAGVGWVRLKEVAPFYEDMTREFVNNGGNANEVVDCRTTFCEHLDAMGVRAGREYVTLVGYHKQHQEQHQEQHQQQHQEQHQESSYQEPNQEPKQQYQEPQQHHQQQDQQFHYYHHHQQQQQSQQYCYQQQYHLQYCYQQQFYQQYQEQHQEPYQETCQQQNQEQQQHQETQQQHRDSQQQQQEQPQQYCYHQQFHYQQHQQQGHPNYYYQQHQDHQQQQQQSEQHCYQQQYYQQYQDHHQDPYQETCQQLHYHQQQQEACQQFLYQQHCYQQLQEPYHCNASGDYQQQQQYHQMCQTWGAGYLSEMGYVDDNHFCCS
eukprot:jgi/Undpi1/10121/HiC_scaffold_28.g12575.m1